LLFPYADRNKLAVADFVVVSLLKNKKSGELAELAIRVEI